LLDYEMVLVINPDVEVAEEQSHPIVDKVVKLITAKGGTIPVYKNWATPGKD
jgi:ribosomal protein S6